MGKKLRLKDLKWEIYHIKKSWTTGSSPQDIWYDVHMLVKWSDDPCRYRSQLRVECSIGLELGCICIHNINVDWGDYDLETPTHVAKLIATEIRTRSQNTSPSTATAISPLWQLLELQKENRAEVLEKFKVPIEEIAKHWQQSIAVCLRKDADRLEKDLARNG